MGLIRRMNSEWAKTPAKRHRYYQFNFKGKVRTLIPFGIIFGVYLIFIKIYIVLFFSNGYDFSSALLIAIISESFQGRQSVTFKKI